MVEPLGTAPRSDPLITSAFMSIAQRARISYNFYKTSAIEIKNTLTSRLFLFELSIKVLSVISSADLLTEV